VGQKPKARNVADARFDPVTTLAPHQLVIAPFG